ncbi:chemotaxis protein CheB [Deltaproteobacteria bacterium TL4]
MSYYQDYKSDKLTTILLPGEVLVTQKDMVISTVLGSCVAVCLWDEKHRLGGMNHVMLPVCGEQEVPTTKFANVSTFVLCHLLKDKGLQLRSLSARVFGGADSRTEAAKQLVGSVGLRNLEVTFAVLQRLGLPVTGQDIGGGQGRKIWFDVGSGKIKMVYLTKYDFTRETRTLFKTSENPTLESLSSRPVGTPRVIAIGASTGGTEAINKILAGLPPKTPGIVIAQHMPEAFTPMFAERLNQNSQMEVREARNGDEVREGLALLAPGNQHMELKLKNSQYYVMLSQGPKVCRHRPSIDVLFKSVAETAGKQALGVLLTGMGYDGAQGLLTVRKQGAITLVQDEASSVVFGMNKAAIELGGAQQILSLSEIASRLSTFSFVKN